MRSRTEAAVLLTALLAVVQPAGGCAQQMADQPRKEPLEASDFFADGKASRSPVAGTVPRDAPRPDPGFRTGVVDDGHVAELPFELSREVLERGRERYEIFCSPCHDRVGTGRGMVVRRGFRRPASLHVERLRERPLGYYVDVMANGFGAMPSFAAQVPPRDRWSIAAYIRALQLSQRAALDDVPPERRDALSPTGEGGGG